MAIRIWVGTDVGNEGDWSVVANWVDETGATAAAIPVSTDDVYLEHSTQDVTAGFAQSLVDLNSLNIAQHYTGIIGDATTYLAIGAASCRIGYNDGPGSPTGSSQIKINFGTDQLALVVENSGTSTDSSRPAIRILNVNVLSTVENRKGTLGVAFETGEVSTVLSIGTTFVTSRNTDAKTYVGEGTTVTNVNLDGGDTTLDAAATITSLVFDAGTLEVVGTPAITTITQRGGTGTYNSTGTITTLTISGGTAEFTKSLSSRTVTNLSLDAGGRLSMDPDILILTNGITSLRPVTYSAV